MSLRNNPLLHIDELCVSYKIGRTTTDVVHNVSLMVHPGEIVALVGESGSGKTTTAMSVLRLNSRNAAIKSGRILFGDTDLAQAGERCMRSVRGQRIGLIPQDPGASLNPTQRVGTQVAEAFTVHRLVNRSQGHKAALRALGNVGFENPERVASSYPHELSGGMRQRVLICIATACTPSLVLADEPTSALDVTAQKRILDQIVDLRERSGTAVLLVTHDLDVAADRADTVVVMRSGAVVETGGISQVFSAPRDSYTRQLIRDSDTARGRAATVLPPTVAQDSPAEGGGGGGGGGDLVSVRHLVKEYRNPRGTVLKAVDDISFNIRRGETFGLVGESGSGKSTTGRLILALDSATRGEVRFDGVDVTSRTAEELRQLRRRFQLVYQNPFQSLDPHMRVSQIIEAPLRAHREGDSASRADRVVELLERVDLPADFAKRRPSEMSGGQRQRIAIARALAIRPDLVVCDEAVSALDVTVQSQILELLRSLQAEFGLTLLFISHDLAVVRSIAHRIAVMRNGQIVEVGSAEDIFERPQSAMTRELLDAVPGKLRRTDEANA